MRHGQTEESHGWYWTDGNDVENTGVWTHAYDNSDVTFFGRRISCCGDRLCPGKGDALMVQIGGDKGARGNYCDYDSNAPSEMKFICEAII